MSKNVGFLVVNRRTGFMLEGQDHAAKVFDTDRLARLACKPLQPQISVPVMYGDLVKALIQGTAFCFDGPMAYSKFIKNLSHDVSNKPFLNFSQNPAKVHWRHVPAPVAPGI
jgi:hypothetical protein